jgi:hypothetical protein
MDQDTLRFLLREAVRETVTEVLQTVLELDRTAFLRPPCACRNAVRSNSRTVCRTSVTVSRTASLSKNRKVSWSMGHLLLLRCAPY